MDPLNQVSENSVLWLAACIAAPEDARDGAGLAAGCSPAATAPPGSCPAAADQGPFQPGLTAGHRTGTYCTMPGFSACPYHYTMVLDWLNLVCVLDRSCLSGSLEHRMNGSN